MATDPSSIRHKRIAFDAAVWQVLHRLSLDFAKPVEQLADEAFRDLLKKHRRPVTLSEALTHLATRHRTPLFARGGGA